MFLMSSSSHRLKVKMWPRCLIELLRVNFLPRKAMLGEADSYWIRRLVKFDKLRVFSALKERQ